MLEPQSRLLVLDALRPPHGFTFDEGIGTTFSLDLLALLTAPLAFTMFDAQDPTHLGVAGSMEVLHSARLYASRLTMFCHASRVSVPKAMLAQYAFLEESIVECEGRNRALFHPKVWVLRFVNPEGARLYRVLCLSRNLTFANSWDTALVLDEGPTTRPRRPNVALAEFIAALPALATRPTSEVVNTRVRRLSEEVRNVEFSLPDGFTDLQFWPMGIAPGPVWPFTPLGKRLLVISPFLADACLERLGRESGDAVLVSSSEDLMKLRKKPTGFNGFQMLHDTAVADFLDGEVAETDRDAAQLCGLHAKCYVTERGTNAHIWTGSANATAAAFGGNVEFLTELVGPKEKFGIDTLLTAGKDDLRFANLLTDASQLVATKEVDPNEESLRTRMELARALLAEARLSAAAEESGPDRWTVVLTGQLPEPLPAGISVWCWPLAASGRRQQLGSEPSIAVSFPELSFEALSAFFVCRIEGRLAGHSDDCQFVLTVPLSGAPADRAERILRSLVKDQAALMRFLFLLLSDAGEALVPVGEDSGHSQGEWQWSHAAQPGLFELLVRALEHSPGRLDDIARLIADLDRDPEKAQVIPDRFKEVWAPVWAARTEGRADV